MFNIFVANSAAFSIWSLKKPYVKAYTYIMFVYVFWERGSCHVGQDDLELIFNSSWPLLPNSASASTVLDLQVRNTMLSYCFFNVLLYTYPGRKPTLHWNVWSVNYYLFANHSFMCVFVVKKKKDLKRILYFQSIFRGPHYYSYS